MQVVYSGGDHWNESERRESGKEKGNERKEDEKKPILGGITVASTVDGGSSALQETALAHHLPSPVG